MRYLNAADLHLTAYKPDCRIDEEDWLEVLNDKMNFIAETAKEVDAVIFAGDIFDLWGSVRFEFMSRCVAWMQKIRDSTKRKLIYTIAGNHDCPNHSYDPRDLSRSPYFTMVQTGIFHDLHLNPVPDICTYIYTQRGRMESDTASLCVAHKGLYLNKKPFPTAPDSGNVYEFVKLLPESVKYVVAGDYHTPFSKTIEGVKIINCGSMLRRRADQIDYKPGVWILDTEANCDSFHEFSLKHPIRRDYIDSKRETREMLNELVGSIDGDFEVTMNYRDNFTRMAESLPEGRRMIDLFNRMTERK